MSYIQEVINTKSINELLKEVLSNNELTIAIPNLANEITTIISSINKGPIDSLMPESTIKTLNEAFNYHYSGKDINRWVFDRVYTRTEKKLDYQYSIAYLNNKKSDRIEFTKIINQKELGQYLYEFKQLGLTQDKLTENELMIGMKKKDKIKSESIFGLEVSYEKINQEKIKLRLSTLIKSKPTKGLNRFFI